MQRRQTGFTLLEVMLVITLMALFVSFVVVNMGGQDKAEELKKQAQRFQVIFDMASDMAILNQRQLGLRINEEKQSFAFMYLDQEQRWQLLTEDNLFKESELPDPFTFELQLDGLPWDTQDSLFDDEIFDEELSIRDEGVEIGDEEEKQLPPPQILIYSSGEVTPFSLIFKYEPDFGDDPVTYYRINGIDETPLILEGPLENL
ncbi:type II secretion system minor pseudopilin GspH [Paraneptunicella aestuarii]|uniref:type II secretion system minor pseudopilin GspH n=1 Tax=Paraneptunicella aestuarii TaxID=2831148 RepID=UPI001E414048|nr:type II secretion system minor pseudopilin GspH [Paraneptunicella aestuarii]UAA40654.1 type II secretion system minor pseudopilin GspH [Paraneptunicella aestuarii]